MLGVKIWRISPLVIAAGVWFAAAPVAFTQEEFYPTQLVTQGVKEALKAANIRPLA